MSRLQAPGGVGGGDLPLPLKMYLRYLIGHPSHQLRRRASPQRGASYPSDASGMMKLFSNTVLLLTACLLCGGLLAQPRQEPIQPIEPPTDVDAAKVELGTMLFFDPRLSKSGVISCNSCHNLSLGGTDNLPTSIG